MQDPPNLSEHDVPAPIASRKRSRLRWWLSRAVVLLVVLLVFGVVLVTQTGILTSRVVPIIERETGLEVVAARVVVTGSGAVALEDAVLRVPGIDGLAGEMIQLERAIIDVKWTGIFSGANAIERVRIEKPTLRVSQDTQTGAVNLVGLRLRSSGGDAITPPIEIERGILEIGEHTGASYRLLKRLSVSGELTEPNDQGDATILISARPVEPELVAGSRSVAEDLFITGVINEEGLRAELTGLTLERWPASIVPSRVRETYRSLELSGELAPTRFHIDRDGNPSATLALSGVDLNLVAFEAVGVAAATVEPLRMRNTRGQIRFGANDLTAELNGEIDQIEYEVELKSDGYAADSAFSAEITTDVRIDEGFRPLLFIPEDITSELDRFSDLSADLRATLLVDRASPTAQGASPVKVSGTAFATNATASYKEFPYLLKDITARISFDTERVVLESLEGYGTTGALITASGEFVGFDDNSVVELRIKGHELPIDEALIAGLSPRQAELVEALFSEDQYQRLVESGLVLDPSQRSSMERRRVNAAARLVEMDADDPDRGAVEAQIVDLDRRLAAPAFEFEGAISLNVTLDRDPTRPRGSRWDTAIRAKLPSAGLVPQQFPLPIRASDIEIVILDGLAELKGGRYEGLSGGWAEVEARVGAGGDGPGEPPRVRIRARDIPIDQRLIAAIPGYDEQAQSGEDITLRRILDRLRLGGFVECEASFGPRASGALGYDVEATINQGSARPVPLASSARSRIALEDLSGTIYVTESMVVVFFESLLSALDGAADPAPITLQTQLTLPPKVTQRVAPWREDDSFGPPAPGPALSSRMRVEGLDMTMPIEDAIDVVSPDLARTIAQRRDLHNPSGFLSMQAIVDGFVGGAVASELRLDWMSDLSFELQGHQYESDASIGRVSLELGTRPELKCEGFGLPIRVDGVSAGEIKLDGVMPLARSGSLLELKDAPPIAIEVRDGRLGSPGMRVAADTLGLGEISSFLDDYGVDGGFNLLAEVTPQDQTRFAPRDSDLALVLPRVTVEGGVEPTDLSMTRDGKTLEFDDITGSITFVPNGGLIESVDAIGNDARLKVDGSWGIDPDDGASMDLRLSAQGDLLGDAVGVVVPDPVQDVIDALEIAAAPRGSIDNASLKAGGLGTQNAWLDLSGNATLQDVSMRVGLELSQMDTSIGFDVRRRAGNPVEFGLDVDADRFLAGPLRLHNASAQILSDPQVPSGVMIPSIRAGLHGGIIAGSAWAGPGPVSDQAFGRDEASTEPWIALELVSSGVRAAPLFEDLGISEPEQMGPWNMAEDFSRGSMSGSLSLSGPTGSVDRWTGRGTARVAGGRVLELPGLINLIEASNFRLPSGSRLDLAEGELYLDGSLMAFERLSVSSKAVEILGYGTMDWTSRAVDLRFRSRPIAPIPFVSAVIEGLRDELITTRVTGTPGELAYQAEQFGTIGRLIDAMRGRPETEQQRRLREVYQQNRFGSGRLRDTAEKLERPNTSGGQVRSVPDSNETRSASGETTDE